MHKLSLLFLTFSLAAARLHYGSGLQADATCVPIVDFPTGNTCTKNTGKAIFDQLPDTQLVFSGYLKVKDTYKSKLGFIFYGSQDAKTLEEVGKRPTVIWLNGGPGSSSQLGNFLELGPMLFARDGTKTRNPHSWNNAYNVMFVDQPVGTGISYCEANSEIPTDQDEIGAQFLYSLLQFLAADDGCVKKEGLGGLLTAPWFVFGESYAGKYVPTIAQAILKYNEDPQTTAKIPLKGAGIGDPFTDPYSVIAEYASYSYNFGLIDFQERSKAERQILYGMDQINKGKFVEARQGFESSLDTIITQSGGMNVYNVLEYGTYENWEKFAIDYLNLPETKTLMGFNKDNVFQLSSAAVQEALKADFMKRDCVERVEFVLEKKLPFLIYNGQNDLICSTPGTLRWVYNLKFANSEEYRKKDLTVWKLKSGKVAGYSKSAGFLELVLVNNAGHLVPTDQPEAALEMLTNFVEAHKGK